MKRRPPPNPEVTSAGPIVPRVIDIETTGIDKATDAIIEIASVDLVRGGGVANARSTYVAPGRQISPVASLAPLRRHTGPHEHTDKQRTRSQRRLGRQLWPLLPQTFSLIAASWLAPSRRACR